MYITDAKYNSFNILYFSMIHNILKESTLLFIFIYITHCSVHYMLYYLQMSSLTKFSPKCFGVYKSWESRFGSYYISKHKEDWVYLLMPYFLFSYQRWTIRMMQFYCMLIYESSTSKIFKVEIGLPNSLWMRCGCGCKNSDLCPPLFYITNFTNSKYLCDVKQFWCTVYRSLNKTLRSMEI